MPRGPRLDFPGALHHVMARGIERCDIFRSDDDRLGFVQRLSAVIRKTDTQLFAWSLMPNHVHLLVRTNDMRLSTVMRRLLGAYASAFNRRHHRCGHLFQNRFKSILVEEEGYLLELVRYIHLNPVRAGIVVSLDDLDAYPWTGHVSLLGNSECPWQQSEPVLSLFGHTRGAARTNYREFVDAGFSQGRRPELSEGTIIGRLGRRVLTALRRGRERWAADERVLGSPEFVLQVIEQRLIDQGGKRLACGEERLERLLDEVALRCALSRAELANNGLRRVVVDARAIVSFVAVRHYGFPLSRVARALNVSVQSVLRGIEAGPNVLDRYHWTRDLFAA